MSWEMRLGDSLSAMRAMDSSSVDHVICDPPYDKKTHKGMRNSDGVVQLGFEALSTMAHVREMLRVAKRWVIAFCAMEQLGEYKLFAGDSWVRAGAWVRTNSMPQQSGDRPGQGAEGIAIMYAGKGRMAWNGGGRPAVWTGPRTNGNHHPTEKPEWLMEQLVRDFTDYGETILDTHAGSGTTGVAAVRLGRNFIGYEMLDKHHRTATMRLRGTNEQMDLKFKPKRKPKQIKLIGGSDGKEKGEVQGEDGGREAAAGEDVPAGVRRDLCSGAEQGDRQDPIAGEEVGKVDLGDRVPEVRPDDGDETEADLLAQEAPEEDGSAEFGADEDRGW